MFKRNSCVLAAMKNNYQIVFKATLIFIVNLDNIYYRQNMDIAFFIGLNIEVHFP